VEENFRLVGTLRPAGRRSEEQPGEIAMKHAQLIALAVAMLGGIAMAFALI